MPLAYCSIAILGTGALGTYYGTRLGLAGADVRFLMRGDFEAVKRRGSVVIHENGTKAELRPARVFGRVEDMGPVDLVLVTLKTTANAALPSLVPPLLTPATTLLTLQNGLGTDEFLARHFGAERVCAGLAFIASTRTGPGEVTCYHPGSITIGEFGRPVSERLRALAAQFREAGVAVQTVDDLQEARWRKLVWNVPFNGLAVANNVTTDVLCRDAGMAEDARGLMREVQAAAGAFGYAIPDNFLQQQFAITLPMGAYQPSSLVDFRAGRDVEVEAIIGEPLRRATAAGVSLPRWTKLYGRLRGVLAVAQPNRR